jgi:hypothetical protein
MDDKIKGIMARIFKGALTDDKAMDEGLEKLFENLSQEDAEKVEEILSKEGSLALYGFRNFDDFLIALGRGEQKAKDAMIEIIGTLKRTS